jgi:hypothetical protein
MLQRCKILVKIYLIPIIKSLMTNKVIWKIRKICIIIIIFRIKTIILKDQHLKYSKLKTWMKILNIKIRMRIMISKMVNMKVNSFSNKFKLIIKKM